MGQRGRDAGRKWGALENSGMKEEENRNGCNGYGKWEEGRRYEGTGLVYGSCFKGNGLVQKCAKKNVGSLA